MWSYFSILFIRWWLPHFNVNKLPRRRSVVWNLIRYFFLLCFFFQKLLRYFDLRIISFALQLISYRLGWHWEKLLKLVQNRSLGKSSYLSWKTPSPSKCTSCSLFWKVIHSACKCSVFNAESKCCKALKHYERYMGCIGSFLYLSSFLPHEILNLCCCVWACNTNFFNRYDMEATHFKESIRDEKRQELETEALKVRP